MQSSWKHIFNIFRSLFSVTFPCDIEDLILLKLGSMYCGYGGYSANNSLVEWLDFPNPLIWTDRLMTDTLRTDLKETKVLCRILDLISYGHDWDPSFIDTNWEPRTENLELQVCIHNSTSKTLGCKPGASRLQANWVTTTLCRRL